MQSPDLLKNTPISLSLYFNEINKTIFQDARFLELQNILSNPENLNRYTYALYSDINLLAENIFMPIFHSVYLASGVSNVLVESEKDLWLIEAFPNNRYYFMGKEPSKEILEETKITVITSIEEIGKVV
jgi:hypothetical protein